MSNPIEEFLGFHDDRHHQELPHYSKFPLLLSGLVLNWQDYFAEFPKPSPDSIKGEAQSKNPAYDRAHSGGKMKNNMASSMRVSTEQYSQIQGLFYTYDF